MCCETQSSSLGPISWERNKHAIVKDRWRAMSCTLWFNLSMQEEDLSQEALVGRSAVWNALDPRIEIDDVAACGLKPSVLCDEQIFLTEFMTLEKMHDD